MAMPRPRQFGIRQPTPEGRDHKGTSPRGGGIYDSPSGTLTLSDSIAMTVSDSTRSGNVGTNPDGGAIYNVGTLAISSTTLSNKGGSNAFGVELSQEWRLLSNDPLDLTQLTAGSFPFLLA